MIKSISEILSEIEKTPAKEKVDRLQFYSCPALHAVLQYALDPRVEWLLPVGIPPYKPCEHLDQHGNLHRDVRKLNNFVKGGNYPDMHPLKREVLFIQFIEGLDPEDAVLLCNVKDKRIPYKSITTKLVNSAFPGLIQV
jgi:hypothetical protein